MKYVKEFEDLIPKKEWEKQEAYEKRRLMLGSILREMKQAVMHYEIDSNRLEFDSVEVNDINGQWKIQVIFKHKTK